MLITRTKLYVQTSDHDQIYPVNTAILEESLLLEWTTWWLFSFGFAAFGRLLAGGSEGCFGGCIGGCVGGYYEIRNTAN